MVVPGSRRFRGCCGYSSLNRGFAGALTAAIIHATPMPVAAGTRLDSYEIVAPLGAGGMGEVYRARDTKLMVFDVRTQQWSELVSFTAPGYVVNWIHSPDYKSVDYITGGTDPMLLNVRLADRSVETITSLKGLHRATGPAGNTEISVAPDGSPVLTRDIGTQEIYALSVRWP